MSPGPENNKTTGCRGDFGASAETRNDISKFKSISINYK